jgi:RNA polymerase sigma factor (sigma-70 family)
LSTDDRNEHDDQDAHRLRELADELTRERQSPRANELIAELIIGWRRFYEPWVVLKAGKAGRQLADVVVSNVELRLITLLRRQQKFDYPWRSVVWFIVRKELISELRRLAKHAERETAVAEVFGESAAAPEPSDDYDGPECDVERLRRARAKLSRNDQQVLELLFDRDLGREEAAAEVGIEPGTLSVRRTRAIERLRKAWAEDGEDV